MPTWDKEVTPLSQNSNSPVANNVLGQASTPAAIAAPSSSAPAAQSLRVSDSDSDSDSDKRIIDGTIDGNQLVPFKCNWAWGKYLASCANHWIPQEINMTSDTALWRDPNGLTEAERRIVKRNLRFFVTADSLAANSIMVLGRYRHVTAPDCLFFYAGFAQTLALMRQNTMMDATEQYQCILSYESMHCNFGIDLGTPSSSKIRIGGRQCFNRKLKRYSARQLNLNTVTPNTRCHVEYQA